MTALLNCLRDENGTTAIEFGLIAGLIAAVVLGVVTLLGTDFESVWAELSAAS